MNQSKTLDELYFGWLCGRVDGAVESENYTELLKRLHQTPFVSIVSYDENRIEDGKDLRWEFKPYYTNQQQLWLDQECSVLEMLVSLAGHLAFGISKKSAVVHPPINAISSRYSSGNALAILSSIEIRI